MNEEEEVGNPDSVKVEVKTKEEVIKRIAELRAKMHNLAPSMNRKQRRTAEAKARKVKKLKMKGRK